MTRLLLPTGTLLLLFLLCLSPASVDAWVTPPSSHSAHSNSAAGRIGHHHVSSRSPLLFSSPTPTTVSADTTADATSTSTSEDDGDASVAHLVFPGGGIFFYWQVGAVTYLREAGYDLSQLSMSGASAGALTATLATNDVCFTDATNLALQLAKDAGVWDRSEGLQGVWGPMIETWLDELLPDDAHVTSSDRLSLLVTPVPSFGKTRVTQFDTKQDLIRANMASVHLPWFLDGNLTTNFRDGPHIDGSFLAKEHHYIPEERRRLQRAVVKLDWTEDPGMATDFGDFVKLVSPDGIWGMLEQGKSYAADVMEKRGDFENLPKL